MIRRRFLSRAFALTVIVPGLLGCGLGGALQQTNMELRSAVDSFDRAIDALSRQSADWQVVLENLERTIVADVQSTTRVELTNLMRTGLLGAGGEFRCDADYLRLRTERELRRIRNELAQTLNSAGLRPPIPLLNIAAAEPHICSVVPAAVDASLEPQRRPILHVYGYDLRSLPIDVQLIDSNGNRTNATTSLGVIGDTEMVLDLTSGGANIRDVHRQIVFGWNRAAQSVVRVVVPGSTTPTCTTRTVSQTAGAQSFTPPHTGGDREFDGHGPCVHFDVNLSYDLLRTQLFANYTMRAFECSDNFSQPRSDYTEASGSDRVTLYRVASAAEQIEGFDIDPSFTYEYIDDDTSDDIRSFTGTSTVERLRFVGDTDGHEAGTKTSVEITFRDMRIRVRECH